MIKRWLLKCHVGLSRRLAPASNDCLWVNLLCYQLLGFLLSITSDTAKPLIWYSNQYHVMIVCGWIFFRAINCSASCYQSHCHCLLLLLHVSVKQQRQFIIAHLFYLFNYDDFMRYGTWYSNQYQSCNDCLRVNLLRYQLLGFLLSITRHTASSQRCKTFEVTISVGGSSKLAFCCQ